MTTQLQTSPNCHRRNPVSAATLESEGVADVAEAMLREMAFVFHSTRSIRASLAEGDSARKLRRPVALASLTLLTLALACPGVVRAQVPMPPPPPAPLAGAAQPAPVMPAVAPVTASMPAAAVPKATRPHPLRDKLAARRNGESGKLRAKLKSLFQGGS